jgi:hypothetical protein
MIAQSVQPFAKLVTAIVKCSVVSNFSGSETISVARCACCIRAQPKGLSLDLITPRSRLNGMSIPGPRGYELVEPHEPTIILPERLARRSVALTAAAPKSLPPLDPQPLASKTG